MGMMKDRSAGSDFSIKLMEHLLQYQQDMHAIGQDMNFLRAKLEELEARVNGLSSDEQLEDRQSS